MAHLQSAELPNLREYVDSTGRVVVPVRREECPVYVDAWRTYVERLDPESCVRQNLRQLAEIALDCPVELAYGLGGVCKTACAGMKISKPWLQRPGSPYAPFLWRNYEIGNFEYDLVVYRRPKRSLFCKILCCGA